MIIKKLLCPTFALALFLAGTTTFPFAATTDISETPLAAKNNVPPNFMFMIDNSLSMKNIVAQSPYSSSTPYILGAATDTNACPNKLPTGQASYQLRVSGGVPYILTTSGTNYFGSGSNKWDCTSTNSSKRCTLDTGKTAEKYKVCFDNTAIYDNVQLNAASSAGAGLDTTYTGHFLNWYFGGYTGAVLTGWTDRNPQTYTRIEVAKSAAKAALDTLPLPATGAKSKVRIGLASFQKSMPPDGGQLLYGLANLTSTSLSAVKTKIDDIDPYGYTPLAETLADIGRYLTLGIGSSGKLTLHPEQTDAPPPQVAVSSIFKTSIDNSTGGTLPTDACKSGSDSTACPVQYWCQKNFAFLLTDGRATEDRNISTYLCDYDGDGAGYTASTGVVKGGSCPTTGTNAYDMKSGKTSHAPTAHYGTHTYETNNPSDYLNDVAQALYEMDLRPDLTAPSGRSKKNNLTTYPISFSGGTSDPLYLDSALRETAAQSGGEYLSATSQSELEIAFKTAMNKALDKDGAAAAVAVVNTQLTIDNTAYASRYQSGFWTGDLNAYTVYTSTGIPNSTYIWSAKEKLDALASPASSRKIVTFDGSAGVTFQPANLTSFSTNADLISYLRGDKSLANGTTFRKRNSILGDMVNAEPVVVKYSDGTPVVFQGANDGMLHVFNGCGSPSDPCASGAGEEIWAYIPKMVWSNLLDTDGGLADPVYAHRNFVDATPAVADIGSTKLLVGGLGRGGMGYYALDVSTYSATSEEDAATKVKWEFPDSASYPSNDIGYSYGTPLIVNSPSGWVVLVTSGHNNSSGKGLVFALDPATGALLHTIDTNVGTPTTPAGLAHIAKLSSAGPADVVQFVYGGDLLGNVWRFDLSNWSATKIAELKDPSGNPQPVSTGVAVGTVSGSPSKNFIYAGTGLYLGDSDIPGNTPQNDFATQQQSMYGIIDDTSIASPSLPNIRGSNGSSCPSNGGTADFVCQSMTAGAGKSFTASHNALSNTQTGWYFDLPISNGRIVTLPAVTSGGALAVTINVPTNVTCDPGGQSYFANVDASNGGAIATTYGGSTYYSSITFVGYALASRPVIVNTATGKFAIIRMSDQTFKSPPIYEPPGPPPSPWKRIYWRELL